MNYSNRLDKLWIEYKENKNNIHREWTIQTRK